ncbi:MAG: thioredoxin family protein [Bacteroidota bacterium]
MNIPNTKRLLLGTSILLLFILPSASALNWLSPDLDRLQQSAQREDKLFLLYFSADWCAPCQWMEQNTFQDEQLNGFIDEHYLAAKVDLNNTDNKILQHRFEVDVIPTILVFSTNGKLIARRTATQEPRPLLRWLRHLDKPANHVDATLPVEESQVALTSPQRNTQFSRPALIPDGPALEMLSQETSEPEDYHNPSLVLSGEPVAMVEPSFSPRSSLTYCIRLDQTQADYSSAVKAVTEFERKFEAKAELQPKPDGSYEILLGSFETTGEARQFLLFLQRNDRQGEIIPFSDK